MKKIAFIIFHPVDPQVVKYVAHELMKRNYETRFLYSEKENIIEMLINDSGFNSVRIGSIKAGIIPKLISSVILEIRLFWEIIKYGPNIIFSPTNIYAGLASLILRIPLICWADTENASTNLKYSLPFISALLVPTCFKKEIKAKHKEIRFNSYKEIAYLHPNWFCRDNTILTKLGIDERDKVILMRFSALKATHDAGLKSFGDKKNELLKWVFELEKHARVFISMTEKDLGNEFRKYKLNIHPSEYINLLANCSLYIGEGTTTASEAGVLGIPWIALTSQYRGYLDDQENVYGLGITTDDFDKGFKQAFEWIQDENLLAKWKKKRNVLLTDKIDLSAFLIWFIENYPESHQKMIENPSYRGNFR